MSCSNNNSWGCSGRGRVDAIQNILDGKYSICRGLEYLCEALKDLRCGREFDAQRNVVNGRECITEGLRAIKAGLCEIRGSIGCEGRNNIKDGFHEICCALDELCGVLKDMCCGRKCEAEEGLINAIRRVKKGLCLIEKGLQDVC